MDPRCKIFILMGKTDPNAPRHQQQSMILIPRDTPWSLIHARNVVTLLEAGAIVLPAIPSFYSRPESVRDVVDTVVWRILDQIGLPNPRAYRWKDEGGAAPEP
jgi:4-hydroxy-3-polyprenylbenzoate decarboxylase